MAAKVGADFHLIRLSHAIAASGDEHLKKAFLDFLTSLEEKDRALLAIMPVIP